jgi:hypothetical protein
MFHVSSKHQSGAGEGEEEERRMIDCNIARIFIALIKHGCIISLHHYFQQKFSSIVKSMTLVDIIGKYV